MFHFLKPLFKVQYAHLPGRTKNAVVGGMSLNIVGMAAAVSCERSLVFVAPIVLWREPWTRTTLGAFIVWWAVFMCVHNPARLAVVAVCLFFSAKEKSRKLFF
ncbi:MAG: hypothetical protein ACPGR8_15520 [Limisphaerales bacterium]